MELLSAREMTVLGLAAAGATNMQIAGDLFISVLTVQAHFQHIVSKLGVASRDEAVAWARRRGMGL
jgi:ATP/maltotriose-dependent transcriptional regulator MalT